MRIGTGYDVHKLTEGRKLILGGVEIEHTLGLLGHSDADVLLHAVMDALLGAAALGDIGQHLGGLIEGNGYYVENIDATIIAQKPKLSPYIGQMKGNIAQVLKIPKDQVNVKATTEEGLGFTGAQEGICAQAVCLLGRFYENSVMVSGGACGRCPGCQTAHGKGTEEAK